MDTYEVILRVAVQVEADTPAAARARVEREKILGPLVDSARRNGLDPYPKRIAVRKVRT